MKSTIASAVIAIALIAPGVAAATDMPILARKNNCTACHEIDTKKVGPAWRDVAAKYKNDPAAATKLVAKVSKGGGGVWGTMPMPGNDPAGKKQDQMKELVKFILSL